MAQLDSVFTFIGKLGNVVGYNRGKKRFVRTMPKTVQQTDGTRRAAQRFGVASRKGSLIRSAFAADLDIHCDGGHVNRLTKAIIQAGRNNHGGIVGFKFSQYADVSKFFTFQPTFTKDGKLHIPKQQLHRFRGVNRLEVKLIASRINFAERRVMGTDAAVLYIDMHQPFEGAELSVDVPGQGTLVVTMQVRGYDEDRVSCNRKYLAADIIAVTDPQTQEVVMKKEHPYLTMYRSAFEPKAQVLPSHAVIQRE